ncbi:hypothetical protein Glove_213g48 [Diversispora epigaea]|uniref:Protein kinase domain-containing protein n=1 Tax=Diversispora epigaea TaxID=1348612 RepID=A0A397IMV7_9GLOM|nr:hypothetical protein Glove_213g48 [Diversispora epigaea]
MADHFATRKLEGSNVSIKCTKCKSRIRINSLHLCKRCFALVQIPLIVNSGNKNIDDFIKKSQSPKCGTLRNQFLEWVPYEKFANLEYIGKGGFSEIYKATWEKRSINYQGICETKRTEVVLKVLNDSQNVDTEFIKELKYTHQIWDEFSIKCYGVTQVPTTKNYAFILEYAKNGDLHHFLNKNFEEMAWMKKTRFLGRIVYGIKKIHDKKVIHRDLHSGNILVNNTNYRKGNYNYPVISDLGFSQPANIDSNLSRESQIYGIIPYMAPELFKNQPYSYASDIYGLGMIMWELTSGHRPFHNQEHGPKLILDILDGKRPEITEDTPEHWVNLMKRCWHSDPSQRPTIQEIKDLSTLYGNDSESIIRYNPDKYENWLKLNKAEKKRLEMIKSKKPFVKNPGFEHPNSRYYSISLNSILESMNSTVSDIFSNDDLFSNDRFDIMDINSNQINENSDSNSSAENSKKHFLDELLQDKVIVCYKRLIANSRFTRKSSAASKLIGKLKCAHQIWNQFLISNVIGVTQIPKTKNYAFILEYATNGDLHHFLNKKFGEMTWMEKARFLYSIFRGIKKIHAKKIIHQDLHSGNILHYNYSVISDLGFSQPATIKPNLSRKSQIYGIIPYVAPELFKNQHIHMQQIFIV